jgi:hypothetical protein
MHLAVSRWQKQLARHGIVQPYRNGSGLESTNPCGEIMLTQLTETEKYDQGNQRREAIMAQRAKKNEE